MMNTSIPCILRVNVNMTHKRVGMEWFDRRNSLIDCKYMCVIPCWFQNAHLRQQRWATSAVMRPWKWPSYFCTLILTRESLKMQSPHRKGEGVKRILVRCFSGTLFDGGFLSFSNGRDWWWLADSLAPPLLEYNKQEKYTSVSVLNSALCCIPYCMLHNA